MKCVMCESQKEMKASVLKTHKFKECGLSNVVLHGVHVYKCDDCGEVYYNYGDIEKLHATIASLLIRKEGLLSGEEIKFLRKYLGYSGQYFAKIIGYDTSHLSRIENGKLAVAETFDRLVRFMVQEKIPDRNYNIQDLILSGKLLPIKNLDLTTKDLQSWTYREAA